MLTVMSSINTPGSLLPSSMPILNTCSKPVAIYSMQLLQRRKCHHVNVRLDVLMQRVILINSSNYSPLTNAAE